ncbi:MAG: hypothetical protein HQK51_02020 [Oligoflexia bacterium]|nr:hypothetical protein [Oligoflexia bacterium]
MVNNVPPPLTAYRSKIIFNFGLFAIFFIFYMGAAVIQTPSFREIASLSTLGMPLGLLLSMLIFPISWIIIIVWFWRAK